MERGELLKEYESIPKRRPSGECTIAQLPESGDKNRFQDVLPYDDTRVELVPTKENNTGYINASHVKVSCADVSSTLTLVKRPGGNILTTVLRMPFRLADIDKNHVKTLLKQQFDNRCQ